MDKTSQEIGKAKGLEKLKGFVFGVLSLFFSVMGFGAFAQSTTTFSLKTDPDAVYETISEYASDRWPYNVVLKREFEGNVEYSRREVYCPQKYGKGSTNLIASAASLIKLLEKTTYSKMSLIWIENSKEQEIGQIVCKKVHG